MLETIDLPKSHIPYLYEIVTFLAAAIFIAPIFRKLKLSPVLGYLTAGAVIGPYALGYVDDIKRIQAVGELGVVFLLFLIGLELPLERLKAMRKYVFGLGMMQVILSTITIMGIALYLGFPVDASFVIGGALALSSTALILQLLSERNEMTTRHGRATFSTLLFQDLAVVPLLAITLVLGQGLEGMEAAKSLGMAFAKALLAIALIILFGKYCLRPLYKFFASAKDQEIFTAATLFIVLAVSAATEFFGLSLALGAFLAGMLIAETEYRHQVETDIKPFQGLLLGLFFMSVGMTINFGLISEQPQTIFGLVAALIIVKGIIVYGLAKGFGLSSGCSKRTALLLAQGGEFAFVILNVAKNEGVVDGSVTNILFIAVSISMVLTPLLVTVLFKGWRSKPVTLDTISKAMEDETGHIVIVGFSELGQSVAKKVKEMGKSYIALDMDTQHVEMATNANKPVYYGNACRIELLRAVGADRADSLVVAYENRDSIHAVLKVAHKNFPDLQILVVGADTRDCKELIEEGATAAVLRDEQLLENMSKTFGALSA